MNVSRIIKLKDDEKVLAIVRNHWVTHLLGWIAAFAFVAAPFFLMVPLVAAGAPGLAVGGVLEAIGLFVFLRSFVVWRWNAFVVTTHRVIDVDQRGFFSRTVSEATFDKIQDVSYSIKGVWGTIFRFGAVELQTAGSTSNLELPATREPKDVHHLITETMASYHDRANGGAKSEKVAALLDAASHMSDAEARAFIVALQEAVDGGSRSVHGIELDDKDLEWLKREIDDGKLDGK